MSEAIKNRYEFIILFDVENGNPNGDPDAGNLPRVDAETGHGLVTDVCLKRKIRNYVDTVQENMDQKEQHRFQIYIKNDATLNSKDQAAYQHEGVDKSQIKDLKKENPSIDIAIRDYMCREFYDIRTFGAVMTTFVSANLNCGQIRGPVQIGFARSIDPIFSKSIAITRLAVTTEKDALEKRNTMGNIFIIPYALYRAEGYVSANLARRFTGFSEEDLELLWEAIINMFEHDHSAARGKMAVRELIVFRHESELGNAPSHRLFDLVQVHRREGVQAPRAYTDYEVRIDEAAVPAGVTCIRKV